MREQPRISAKYGKYLLSDCDTVVLSRSRLLSAVDDSMKTDIDMCTAVTSSSLVDVMPFQIHKHAVAAIALPARIKSSQSVEALVGCTEVNVSAHVAA